MEKNTGSLAQKEHYEKIHDLYEQHYYDPTSIAFREQFIYKPLLNNIDLNNKRVADLACGSGYNSLYLKNKFPEIITHGFDISAKACAAYRQIVGSEAYELDLTATSTLNQQYDHAIVVGGIHHCIASLENTFLNISQMLKPGGSLLMCEASSSFMLESVRKLWYKKSKYFDADSEEALQHDQLHQSFGSDFEVKFVKYMGGPAYFLILNSLILNLPLSFKKFISKPLFFLEEIYNLLPGDFFFPYFLAEWVKK
ncbi:class I SAM-dependent methyltransferase [Legionella sp. PATHC038]|uniref:class I SAM-dependent methyltransferase n=1 Tax=Legionella sheltonii TaxID=2992041 RepID=UPI002244AD0B|nr:class I SAM-dependent methyltransferase [Legionella sp. PATHC038]MCW8397213.1 class I SAM-dependent methyltransferase [Legionella sp. PATHC038]